MLNHVDYDDIYLGSSSTFVTELRKILDICFVSWLSQCSQNGRFTFIRPHDAKLCCWKQGPGPRWAPSAFLAITVGKWH